MLTTQVQTTPHSEFILSEINGITGGETRVLKLIYLRDRSISEVLGYSYSYVEHSVAKMLRIFRVRSRTGLMRAALAAGFVIDTTYMHDPQFFKTKGGKLYVRVRTSAGSGESAI